MRIKIRPLLMAGGLALVLVPASYSTAQTGSQQQETRARLEQNARNVDTELRGKTGGMQRVELMRQRREIDAAIKRLQAGQRVSTEEIDRILGEVSFERAK
jgi:hypothetical protein